MDLLESFVEAFEGDTVLLKLEVALCQILPNRNGVNIFTKYAKQLLELKGQLHF